jgi:hypothetical protein
VEWRREEWFSYLVKQIESTTIDQLHAYEYAERGVEMKVDGSSPDEATLEIIVPSCFEDVRGIRFHFVSPSNAEGTAPSPSAMDTLVLIVYGTGDSIEKGGWGGSYANSS